MQEEILTPMYAGRSDKLPNQFPTKFSDYTVLCSKTTCLNVLYICIHVLNMLYPTLTLLAFTHLVWILSKVCPKGLNIICLWEEGTPRQCGKLVVQGEKERMKVPHFSTHFHHNMSIWQQHNDTTNSAKELKEKVTSGIFTTNMYYHCYHCTICTQFTSDTSCIQCSWPFCTVSNFCESALTRTKSPIEKLGNSTYIMSRSTVFNKQGS